MYLHPFPFDRLGHFDRVDVFGNDDDAPGNHLNAMQGIAVRPGRRLAIDFEGVGKQFCGLNEFFKQAYLAEHSNQYLDDQFGIRATQ